MYFNDGPGLVNPSNGFIGLIVYHNFREWFVVRLGGENAPSEKFSWHSFQAVERNPVTGKFEPSATGTNSIGPGHLFWGVLPNELSSKRATFTTSTLANAQSNEAYNQQIGAAPAPRAMQSWS